MATTKESQQVSEAYHLALAYLGYSVMQSAWREWLKVDLSRPRQTTAAWADAVMAQVKAAREAARLLTALYYRLIRALETGRTVPLPEDVKPPKGRESTPETGGRETIGDLRRDFRLAIEDIVPPQREKPTTPHTKRVWERAGLDDPLPSLPTGGFDQEVEVEDFEWVEADDDEIEVVLEKALDNLVVDIERKRREREGKERSADDEKAHTEDRREKVGTTQAGIAQLSVLNAGRRPLYLAGGKDSRTIGYIRMSRTGDPCAFCAMLISRGLVLYKSEQSAGTREDGELYHPNCNCVAVPVFSKTQYESDDRFALNRELNQLWKDNIHGRFSGEDALNAWRRLLRRKRVAARETKADAQAA